MRQFTRRRCHADRMLTVRGESRVFVLWGGSGQDPWQHEKDIYGDNIVDMDKERESLRDRPHNKEAFEELREILKGVREQLNTAKKLAEDPDKLPDYLEYILVISGISGIEKAVSEMEEHLNEWEMETC
jgi:hypothetical protein